MMNNCNFIGRLAGEVDMRYTPNGKAVANLSLAVQRAVPNQNGDREVDYFRHVAWGKPAETMANQLSKGDMIAVTSRAQTRSYDDENGKKQYITEFVIEGFPTFLKVKKWENGNNNGSTQNQNSNNNNPFEGQAEPIDIDDNDLPF
ncbi:single-stranded DNA-binding protein [Ornithinibacillus contaminans]|uniref:single-stranded DNA-binding protein n=1 Tax=Ornithinibacillus contaminans TaxID=694055 RepID=UPI00064DA74C|nr:single-stranded DNA-binding protein [Ornithinibacillus contaminans]